MQRTTKHLKSFARKEVVELSLIDMRVSVAAALDLVAPRLRDLGVVPEYPNPDDAVFVIAGAIRIEQVVVNLMLNALDAIADKQDGNIGITLTTHDGQASLCVSDTGVGIAEADLSLVGEPFTSTKPTGEGLGLGLAICKAILADFNGSLDIASTKGQGTQVTVTLPLAVQQKANAA
jgi:two-component system C4-dicarboxylate transport sensor histidine kinase DctB